MPVYEIRGQRHTLCDDKAALRLECDLAIYEGNCSGNNPEMLPVFKLVHQVNTLFGSGEWRDDLEKANEEAESAYHLASTSHNTAYTPDVEVKTKLIGI